jgi:hypothetical protein
MIRYKDVNGIHINNTDVINMQLHIFDSGQCPLVHSLWFFRNSLHLKGMILQIIKKLEKKEDLAKYCLFMGGLYCQCRYDQKHEVVVTTAAVPVLFSYYPLPATGHLGV